MKLQHILEQDRDEDKLGRMEKTMFGDRWSSVQVWDTIYDTNIEREVNLRTAEHKTPKDVEEFLNLTVKGEWEITPDDEIVVHGDVDLTKTKYERIPFKFEYVTGTFICNSELKTLQNAPYHCGSFIFNDARNLKTLEGCPAEIEHVFKMVGLQLTTVAHGPNGVGEVFVMKNTALNAIRWPVFGKNGVTIDISNNSNIKDFNELNKFVRSVKTLNADNCKQLSSLAGLPQYVINLHVNNCSLKTLDVPDNVKMIKHLYAKGNPFDPCPPEQPKVVQQADISC